MRIVFSPISLQVRLLTLQILCLFEPLPVVTSHDAEEGEGPPAAANVLEICKMTEEIPASLDLVRGGGGAELKIRWP